MSGAARHVPLFRLSGSILVLTAVFAALRPVGTGGAVRWDCRVWGVVCLGLCVLAGLVSQGPPSFGFAVSSVVVGLAVVVQMQNRRCAGPLWRLAAVSWMFSAWSLARTMHPLPWNFEQTLAASLTTTVSGMIGIPVLMGSTASGLSFAILHLLTVLVVFPGFAGKQRRIRGIALGLVPIVVHLGYIAIFAIVQKPQTATNEAFPFDPTLLLCIRFGLESLWLCIAGLWVVDRSAHPVTTSPQRFKFGLALLSITGAVGLLLHGYACRLTTTEIPTERRAFLLDVSDAEDHEPATGELRNRLEDWGFSVHALEPGGELDSSVGAGDCVVLLYPFPHTNETAFAGISPAVERGAGLLVAVDHTLQNPTLERLLATFGFGLHFDSAFAAGVITRTSWHESRLRRAWQGLHANHYGVGASLRPPNHGSILLVGQNHFSDAGDLHGPPENFLGNRRYDPGERVGDLVLAAQARFGRGRVVVFGDPSSFYADALPMTQAWVRCVFEFLCRDRPGPLGGEGMRLVIVAFLVVASILAPFFPREMASTVPWWVVGVLSLSGWGSRATLPSASDHRPRVLVDVGQFEEMSLYPRQRFSIEGLCTTLREDGVAVDLGDHAKVRTMKAGDGLVFVAPQQRFAPTEVYEILEFAKRGGHVLISAGWKERHSVVPLLQHAGLQLIPVLTRSVREGGNSFGQEKDAVVFRQSFGLERLNSSSAEILAAIDGIPVAAMTPVGLGSIAVIADPSFLLGTNLVFSGGHIPGNQALLRQTLGLVP